MSARRPAAVAVLAVVCAVAASGASAEFGHRLKPGPLAFMRSVTLPETPVPRAVRTAFAEHRFAGAPRRAISVPTAHGPISLWVSPHRGGGWCEGLHQPGQRFWVNCYWWKAEYGAFGPTYLGPKLFLGRAAVTAGRRLVLLFHDRGKLSVPTKDGFFLFRVPDRRLVRAPPSALVLAQGRREIAKERLSDVYGTQQLLTPGRRPAGAIGSRTRRLIVGQTPHGAAAILVAPSKFRRAHCWWLQVGRGSYSGGCVRDSKPTSSIWSVRAYRLSIRGHELDVLWGRVGRDYARLGLRFQDGRRLRLPRVGSYFLYVVPGRERAQGHRPASVVARDASGKIARKELLLPFTWAR